MRKWDGSAHWRTELRYLGADEFGHWLGSVPGNWVRRPGAEFLTRNVHIRWVPRDKWWIGSFNAPPAGLSVYVDMTTPGELVETATGWQLSAVDLDLDVVLRHGEPPTLARIVDQDEFAERRVTMCYPDDVVRRTEDAAEQVLRELQAQHEPYATRASEWRHQLRNSGV